MKERFLLPFVAVLFLILGTGLVSAQNTNGQSNGNSAQTSSQVSTNNQGESTQNTTETQNRTQTNNPDIGTMTQEEIQLRTQESIVESEQTYSAKDSESQARSRKVAEAAKNMITLSYQIENQSLGSQIRNIAQQTNTYQDQANQAIDKADERSGFAKFFVGPNYNQLTEVKQAMTQNQLMIRQLNQIRAQITNAGQSTDLENQIQVLENENTALGNKLDQLESGFSLFGWLARWIKGYTN